MKRKAFYYTSKDFTGATYREIYHRVSRWIKINFTLSGVPFFTYDGHRYKLDNFIRCDYFASCCASEVISDKGEKITLAGYQGDVYYKPYFIEIDSAGESVRVYEYQGSEKCA